MLVHIVSKLSPVSMRFVVAPQPSEEKSTFYKKVRIKKVQI
jgi:hypothetical protein